MNNFLNADLPATRNTRREMAWVAVAVLILAGFSILLQIDWSPANSKIHSDGTVFAYGGARILEGDIPYRDFWDHKPPGVFYLNALAFWLWGIDAWSVWFLTAVWTVAVALSFFWFLSRVVPRRYAFLGSVVLITMVMLGRFYEGPNLTEFYGLLPSVFSLLLAYYYLSSGRKLMLTGLGCAFAAGALFKHTSIATALACIAIIMFVELRREGLREAVRGLIVFCIPIVIVVVSITLYWGSNGALQDLWQATVEYNLLYVKGAWGLRNIYGSFRTVAADESLGPLFILALGAAIASFSSRHAWMVPQSTDSEKLDMGRLAVEWTFIACFFALILEILLISIAGRGFNHYYLSLMPALCASASYWFRNSSPLWDPKHKESRLGRTQLSLVSASMIVWFLVTFGWVRPSITALRNFAIKAPIRQPLRTNVGKFVTSQTDLSDTLLYWNIGAEINFETNLRAPSRYVYFHPLFRNGFQNKERWQEFLTDLETNQTTMIITQWQAGYAPNFDVPVDELASSCNCDGDILAGFTAFSQYVKDNYERDVLFDDTFAVYSRTSP